MFTSVYYKSATCRNPKPEIKNRTWSRNPKKREYLTNEKTIIIYVTNYYEICMFTNYNYYILLFVLLLCRYRCRCICTTV